MIQIIPKLILKSLVALLIFTCFFSSLPKAEAAAPGLYTTTAMQVLPSAATGVTVTPSTTAWANSAWVQVTAATASAIVASGLVVGGGGVTEYEFDIGKGAAGSETVVATIPGDNKSAAGAPRWLPLPIPVDNIATATRVAVRVRQALTTATTFTVKLGFYTKPLAGSAAVTPNPSLVLPSAAAGVSITPSATAWANSAWVQVTAATASAIALGGVTLNPGISSGVEAEFDVGVGASGSEVVVTTFRTRPTLTGAPVTLFLNPLLDNIASGVRVSVRLRKSDTTTTAWTAKLIFYSKTSIGVTTASLTTKALTWSPTSAVGASVTPSATAWANSAWVQLIASAGSNLALASVEFNPVIASDFELQFGIGSAGNEVPIGVVRSTVLSTAGLGTLNIAPLIDSIPSGARVSVRLRKSDTTVTAWNVSVGTYAASDTTNKLNSPHLTLPAAANSIAVTSAGTAWTNSAYSQMTAGVQDISYITRIAINSTNVQQFEVDVSTGGAGSEVVQTTLAGQVVSAAGFSWIDLPVPIQIPANTRVAVRLRNSGTSGTWNFALEYTLDEQIKQAAYRLFNNANSTDVGTVLAAQNTAASLASTGAAFRVRMLLYMASNKLATNSGQAYKLQFAQQSGTCDTAFVGETYADVTAATVIAYNDNSTPADGATLTANANDPTDGANTIVNQTYEELNNFTNSVAVVPAGQDGKWDFSLKDNGATASTAYCLRAVKSDGTVLDTYTVIPQITTASSAPAQTLTFSLGASSLALGTLSSSAVVSGSHTMSLSTNASSGMVVTYSGLTLTSGANTITACAAGCTSTTGTKQFGINAVANTTPTIGAACSGTNPIAAAATNYLTANSFRFVSGETIVSSTGSINSTTCTVSYMTNISAVTAAGSYTTTLTYVATATF